MDKIIKVLIIIVLSLLILWLVGGLFPPVLVALMCLSPFIIIIALFVFIGYCLGKKKRKGD